MAYSWSEMIAAVWCIQSVRTIDGRSYRAVTAPTCAQYGCLIQLKNAGGLLCLLYNLQAWLMSMYITVKAIAVLLLLKQES